MKVVAECDCGKLYRLPEKYCGKFIRCKACGDAFEVPELEESLEESGMEEDFPDPESEVVHSPKKKSKKKTRESTKKESSATKSRKGGSRASGVRKGRRGDDSGDDKKRNRESSSKKRGPRDSGSRRGASDERKSKGLKRDSKAMKSRRGDKDSKGRGRKGARGDREERGGRRGGGGRRGRRDEGEGKNNNMLYAGIGGGVLLVIIILFVVLGKEPPPDPQVTATYKEVEKLLDKGLSAYQKANMTQSLEYIDTVKKEWDKKDKTKYPIENDNFENFGPKYKEAMALLPKLLKYDSLLVQLKDGKGIADTVKFSKEKDPLLRLASVTLIEQKLKDNKDLQKALAVLAKDSNADVKEKALDLICKLKEPVALPFLIDRIKSNHKDAKTYILLITKMVDKEALKAYYVCLEKLDPNADKDQLSDVSNIIKNINKVGDEEAYKVLMDYRDKWPKDLQIMIDKIGQKYKRG